jgi:uncharacterized protein DUF3108
MRTRGAAVLWVLVAFAQPAAQPARGAETAALYSVSWAGLPAGEIRLRLRDDALSYRDEILIRSEGLPRLVIRFRGQATSEGRLAPAALAQALPLPLRYDASYDLRKRRNRRLALRFAAAAGAVIAERSPEDTSRKPPLAAGFRRNVLDPLSALTAIRDALRRGNRGVFTVPVYDGARRFDVIARVLPRHRKEPVLHLELTLSPIAGFKGETSEDGDPDDAPRPVALTISDDARLMPLSMRVSLYGLPLVVELSRWCGAGTPCGW